jgi:hypothetical protein
MNHYLPIAKYDIYNGRMSTSMMDKLFWVDKVDAQVIVDFGCADGVLLRHVRDWLPNATLVGYDSNREMLERAEKNVPSIIAAHNWTRVEDVVAGAHAKGDKVALVLSSVIHEVYNYSAPEQIDSFWSAVFPDADTDAFDFIAIRDMIPSRGIDRISDVNDVAKVYRKFLHRKELKDFETRWGSIESNKNLVHFLLKYQYVQPNWEREVKENYIPLYREDLMAMLPTNYSISYHEHCVLPYVRRAVRGDFGIELKDQTHLKLILERDCGQNCG